MDNKKCPVSPIEAAAILNISRPQVLLLIKDGILPAAKISPRIIRIIRADVERLLLDNRVVVAPLLSAIAGALPTTGGDDTNTMIRALKHLAAIGNECPPDTFKYLLDRAVAELRALPQSMTLRILIEQAEALRAQLCN
jgi:excisionase family DNA binding protein